MIFLGPKRCLKVGEDIHFYKNKADFRYTAEEVGGASQDIVGGNIAVCVCRAELVRLSGAV
jgi:hypothetical protein